MPSLLRTFLLAVALLTSGVVQAAAAAAEEACCADHEAPPEEPCCPEGITCACCSVRAALRHGPIDVAPAPTPGVALTVPASVPDEGPPAAGIFQPPRA